MRDEICVRLNGGLGNQLFQYAAGRAVSLRLCRPLLLDSALLNQPDSRPYALDSFAIDARIIAAQETEDARWLHYVQPYYHYDENFERVEPGTLLDGYFQSELYFKHYSDQIRKELSLLLPSPSFKIFGQRIEEAKLPVSIHVRRGDFVSNAHASAFHGICGADYYDRALRVMRGLLREEPTFFLFSDDPTAALDLFRREERERMVVSAAGTPAEDMFLMARCRHHVQANSSFSWWGSWLNPNSDKIVIAPRYWVARKTLRNLNTVDLYVDGTIII